MRYSLFPILEFYWSSIPNTCRSCTHLLLMLVDQVLEKPSRTNFRVRTIPFIEWIKGIRRNHVCLHLYSTSTLQLHKKCGQSRWGQGPRFKGSQPTQVYKYVWQTYLKNTMCKHRILKMVSRIIPILSTSKLILSPHQRLMGLIILHSPASFVYRSKRLLAPKLCRCNLVELRHVTEKVWKEPRHPPRRPHGSIVKGAILGQYRYAYMMWHGERHLRRVSAGKWKHRERLISLAMPFWLIKIESSLIFQTWNHQH